MKTRNLFSTLLALALYMTVSSQTQNHQAERRTLQVLGGNSIQKTQIAKTTQDIETNAPQNSKITEVAVKKVYPTLISEEKSIAKDNSKKETIDNNTFNYFNNANCYNSAAFIGQLLEQAEALVLVENTLRHEAALKSGSDKAHLLKSANEIQKQSELKLIQASEIAGKLNLEKYNKNQMTVTQLSEFTHASDRLVEKVNELSDIASFEIKMAKELRQEAYAMHSTSSKLGVLNNAEEKEVSALTSQEKAISILQKYANFTGSNLAEEVATK
ncbi:MAG: hypothetical protein IPM51_09270 [Sphingobacteriaceae bacterium]|nr:hypothetical protein [Sphingobacteriaceae bacterium]